MQILDHQDKRPLQAQFDADLPKDLECFGLYRFGIGKGGRRVGVLYPQQMQQHEAVLIGSHSDALQTRANFFNDRRRGVGL